MSKLTPPPPLPTPDYDAIETAMMETERGRWFLSEYAKRNRNSDTSVLLDAIAKLEATIKEPPKDDLYTKFRVDLYDMVNAIAQTRNEIAALKPEESDNQFFEATEELDAIVRAAENATNDILEAAEEIQETAWLMREQGSDAENCDKLDTRATDIYTACSFQDLTGQRTSKVVQVLQFLEQRINAMIDIWEMAGNLEPREQIMPPSHLRKDAHLLNGPQLEGQGLEQNDVDHMLDDAPSSDMSAADQQIPSPPQEDVHTAQDIEAANVSLGLAPPKQDHQTEHDVDDLTVESHKMLAELEKYSSSHETLNTEEGMTAPSPTQNTLRDPDDLLAPAEPPSHPKSTASADSSTQSEYQTDPDVVDAQSFDEPQEASLSTVGINGRATLFQ